MSKKVWITTLFLLLALAVAASVVITVSFGSTELSLSEVYAILYDHLFAGDARVRAGIYPGTHLKIVWQVRLPRTIFAMLVGAGLAICGTAMQSLVLNPIADPYVLGISSGASLGATAAVMLGSTETTFYTVAVYYGAAGIRRTRHTIPAALAADITGFLAAAWTVRWLF